MILKKLCSIALAATMLFGGTALLPEDTFTFGTSISASAESTATSGKCGDNVSWTLKNGVLTISGKGEMYDYSYGGNSRTNPFRERTDIKSVVIKRGVTSISNFAFDMQGFTSVTIPSSVKSIGIRAFYACQNLKSVNIPSGVTSIGDDAFLNCYNLSNITIPSSVTSIGAHAFWSTKWLINKRKNNPLVIVNGILIDGTLCDGKVSIPNSVTRIGDSAFEFCSNLTGVTISKSVKSIGSFAFDNCTSLKSVTIPSNVTSIGDDAFLNCYNLSNITIPSSVTSIGKNAFDSCTSLKSVTIPSNITSIGDYTFANCKSLTSITIPYSVTRIGVSAFFGCTNLTSVTIPSSVKSIGIWAFYECSSLTSVIIPKSVKSIGNEAFGYYYDYNKESEEKISGFTIYGYKNTSAEKYAKKNGFKFVARNTTEPKTVRYAGSDRAETATKISKAVNAKTSDTVIIATGFDFHDALAAVPLASAYNAPLLLADRDNLSAKTLAEIKRLGAKNIIVVATTNAKDANGNSAAIGKNVYKQLSSYKVTKITGSSYYETAKNVAKNLKTKTGKNPTSVFITTDKNYADALSASPVAAILGAPILYVKPTGNLDSNTKNYLLSIKSTVKNIYIVGGVNAVSKNVEKSVLSVLGKKSATRFAGDNRYDTCVLINKSFAKNLTGKSVCIAKGYNFPDALAGGVFAAKQKAPLFLADALGGKVTISKTQANYLYIKNPSKLYIFGGETAVPTKLVQAIAKASI